MIRIRATLLLGGSWNNGASDGLFTFNVNNDASWSNSNLGFRLADRYTARSWSCNAAPPSAIYLGVPSVPRMGKQGTDAAPPTNAARREYRRKDETIRWNLGTDCRL